MRVAAESYGTTRPRSRRASRASNARIERNVYSAIRSRSRASRAVPTASSHRASTGTARRVFRAAGAPHCAFFRRHQRKFLVAFDARRSRPSMARPSMGRPSWTFPRVARGSRTQGSAVRRRDRVDPDHPAAIGDAIGARATTTTTTTTRRGWIREMRECVRASTHFCQSRTRVSSKERISRVTVREPSTPSVGPRSRRARAGPDSYEWLGIFTVHDPSFSVLIFLIFPPETWEARVARRLRLCLLCIHSRRARLPHTASRRRSTIDANRDRDRSRKNSIDANPRCERLERGRASTQRTRETTRAGAEKNATRGNSRRRTRRTPLGYATR